MLRTIERIREYFRQKKEDRKKALEQRLTEVRKQIRAGLAETMEAYKQMELCGKGAEIWDDLQYTSRHNESLCVRLMAEEKQIEKELKRLN